MEYRRRLPPAGAGTEESDRPHRRPATRVLFEGTAPSASSTTKDGVRRTVRAAKEVILAGGAINSPQLLMLSGIGDRDSCASTESTVQQHLPEVGKNLLDHLVSFLGYSVDSDSLFAAEKTPSFSTT